MWTWPRRGGDLITTIYGTDYLERFGSQVVAVGDLDTDDKADFAISAVHANADGATSLSDGLVTGKVYIFHGADLTIGGTTLPADGHTMSEGGRDLHFGSSLVPFEEGGTTYLAVGAPTALRQRGAVYITTLPAM